MKWLLKKIFGLIVLTLVCACALFLFILLRSPVFEGGESHTYYFGASSSARAVQSASPLARLWLGEVKGESTVYDGDKYEALKQKYRAVLRFSEEACGTTSYYLYSPLLGGGILLNGERVNLQIAVGAEKTAAGSPMIFGGW